MPAAKKCCNGKRCISKIKLGKTKAHVICGFNIFGLRIRVKVSVRFVVAFHVVIGLILVKLQGRNVDSGLLLNSSWFGCYYLTYPVIVTWTGADCAAIRDVWTVSRL